MTVAMAMAGWNDRFDTFRHVSSHISGSKGFQKKLLVPEVGQFIEAYSV